MKKLTFLASALAVGALSGCMGGGGKKTGDDALIELARQQTIAQVSRSQTLFVDTPADIGRKTGEEWQNDYLYLTTHQTVMDEESGKTSVVDIAWTWESDAAIRNVYDADDTHKCVFFEYSKTDDIVFKFSASFSIGEKTSKDTNNYEVKLLHRTIEFPVTTIKQALQANAADTGLEMVDYTKTDGYYYKKTSENFTFNTAEMYGEVVYVAPDGNWALMADGDYYMHLYAGSALNLDTNHYPDLVVGKTIRVWGELTTYAGNTQLGFIFDIYGADASKVARPSAAKAFTGADIDGRHYWQDYLMNKLVTLTVSDFSNPRNHSNMKETAYKNFDEAKASKTLYVDCKVDGVSATIGYGYHVDGGDHALFNALIAKFKAGAAFTLTGTLHFYGTTDEKGFMGNESVTRWLIMPFEASHVK